MAARSSVYIETYGCQMNKLDSENVAAILHDGGFDVVDDMNAADVFLLNTCGVRENAEVRVHGRIGELSSLRKIRPGLVFGVIGCMAQRLGERLISDVVRVVAGPDSYRRLPEMIRSVNVHQHVSSPQRMPCTRRGPRSARGAVDTRLDPSETYDGISPVRESPFSAWVAVTRGCDNFCSYCVVPYTRGRERSIPADRVIAEIERLLDEGFREVTLLGQNVNSYRDGSLDFAGLLDRAADTGMAWIRFLTSHPRDLGEGMIEVMARRANVCPHLHLPLQSGSDRVLRAMNRRYTVDRYLEIVEKARLFVPGISLTTDLIFGFPGETEEDYEATLALMERVRFDFAYLYRYSEREGTPACALPEPVPEPLRIERLKRAIGLQNSITAEKNREQIGRIHTMLLKGRSKDGLGWYGFTETSVPVVVGARGGSLRPGEFTRVLVETTTGASLVGRIV
jgi:tRNA-2-methylthio-N6-dimethylallyladenosine synthase